ncbi:hypothetical protein P153DRAFT_283733 [Dothidotthia symphoricarpi CBS 119687]|uniref:Uncharacterized protein n=1 Tax=Dothidotthia symphoricarpi CBS 119687 TaxID=1392245 RepID=A0A6A6AQD3_9PLEO|nr:uncharacterized protein P153DRAFT_283733 [Dothidotthia symphoricarpi CBS 119687]KAF2133057.1 hypothetical protein P153DRAFT_283733 [Dothidotthia symphoricarpi CBS 119687]
MDEDLLAFGAVMVFFLSMPLIAVLSVTSCIAYSRTKAWDKTRNQQAVALESEPLVDDDDDSAYDTEDEEEQTKRKAEDEADRFLTFGQMYRKNFRKVWSGKNRVDIVKEREREERKKLAKAVAREMDRRERRRARKAEQAQVESLPPYKN